MHSLRSLIDCIAISGVVLDESGKVIEASGRSGPAALAPEGEANADGGYRYNYFKQLAFNDPACATLLRGLIALLKGEMNVFSTLHPWPAVEGNLWYLTFAFLRSASRPRLATVFHADVSCMMADIDEPSALMMGLGPAAVEPAVRAIVSAVRQSFGGALRDNPAQVPSRTADPREQRSLQTLTDQQRMILKHLARGATNCEIAAANNISVGTAKRQTAALIRKLGLSNRTQAALLAVRNGLAD